MSIKKVYASGYTCPYCMQSVMAGESWKYTTDGRFTQRIHTKCEKELLIESELMRQEEIDEHNNQRMADCADACGITHFELFELSQRPDYIDESEES